ncbi:MAG: threonine synthase [Acidimicrobiaceae bacterium]|nr:threonine synthase [Acidimicrobiaceae bacterium]
MKYQSTRGKAPVLEFADVLLAGLASDGGLYVPAELPKFTPADLNSFGQKPYSEVATRVLTPLLSPSIDSDDLAKMIEESYATFRHPEVVPVRPLTTESNENLFLAELFWGPTFSFKDVALQLLGRLFEYELSRRDTSVTIVGATSGDTGSAAIEACRDRDGINLIMLHPRGRVSEIQRRQMTTVESTNIHNIAIDGTFDDCQDLVKAMFADTEFRDVHRLGAVNSINWARVAAQTVYYFTTASKLVGPNDPISFCVPTGNFGNIFAGYIATQMGLPVDRLVIASNHNDILTRAHLSGIMEIREVQPSTSPAMDIQVSSNFERLLFELSGKDSSWLTEAMLEFRSEGVLVLPPKILESLHVSFEAGAASDQQVADTIAELHSSQQDFLDPHTAVGVNVARRLQPTNSPLAVMATAHPAKFEGAVAAATGMSPPQPEEIAALAGKAERCIELAVDINAVMEFVSSVSQ